MREYDQLIDWYVSHRNPQIGVEDVARFSASLAPGSTVLDLGCGDGIPISRSLLQDGFKVYGIDSSLKMIEKFRKNFPDVSVQCSDLLESDFFGMTFDGVVAYGVMFHLTREDQSTVIARVSDHLNDGGVFLFNSGTEEGESVSEMNGVRIPQYSMSSVNYSLVLRQNGLMLVNDYSDEQSSCYVYVAQKSTSRS